MAATRLCRGSDDTSRGVTVARVVCRQYHSIPNRGSTRGSRGTTSHPQRWLIIPTHARHQQHCPSAHPHKQHKQNIKVKLPTASPRTTTHGPRRSGASLADACCQFVQPRPLGPGTAAHRWRPHSLRSQGQAPLGCPPPQHSRRRHHRPVHPPRGTITVR